MSTMTLAGLSEKMRDIDFTMMFTRSQDGQLAGRPMSTNGDVEYDGDSYYFTLDKTRTVDDIERDATVGLSFQGSESLFGKPPLFISVEGQAALIRDKLAFEAHWTSGLDAWFEQGVDTPGLVLIKVHATRIHYWEGMDQGEVSL